MVNILFISADDMSYGSVGCAGCEFPEITPYIDKLASEGVFFKNAHTTVGLCQPSRSVWMTGMYPWKNGAEGFQPIRRDVASLVEILKRHNYSCGILGKTGHLGPLEKFNWDYRVNGSTNSFGMGKSPEMFYDYSKPFLNNAKQPFFLMANSHHPHRPFPEASRYNHHKVVVPPFLPDTVRVQYELSLYYEAVTKCDEIVGHLLKALQESEQVDNTLVIFTSDHGMAFPFVKANCYHYSTKVPLIYRLPKTLSQRTTEEYVSGIDILPTILDIIGLREDRSNLDGRSYYQTLLNGDKFSDEVYTCLVKMFNAKYYQTRAIHNKDFCYIRNFWSNGEMVFMEDGSLDNQITTQELRRCRPEAYKMLRLRTPEEFYDLNTDQFAQTNLISNPEVAGQLAYARKKMARSAFLYGDSVTSAQFGRRSVFYL